MNFNLAVSDMQPVHFQYCSHLKRTKNYLISKSSDMMATEGEFTLRGLLSIITQMGPARDCKGKLTHSQQFPSDCSLFGLFAVSSGLWVFHCVDSPPSAAEPI